MEIYRWHEQEVHSNLYGAELSTLERGLGGAFKLHKLKAPDPITHMVTATGTLSYSGSKAQGVRVSFPTKYPYAPPRVFSVDFVHDQEGNLVHEQVRLFGKGNQYGDGRMCLFREEIWDKNQHNIGWILRRAQEWLEYADSPDGFPREKVVEENPAAIPHRGQVILPFSFVPPVNAKRGQMVLNQFKPNYYILEQNIITSNPFSLSIGNDRFDWYAFDEGTTLKSLLPASTVNAQDFISIFSTYFGENLLQGSPARNIGFYLPSDPMPWHFFKISIQQVMDNQFHLKLDYLISRNIEKDLYLRTKDIFDDVVLKGRRVTIIGLGAIGSEVARSLARNGIGHFNLFDSDTFEVGNSVRHAADLFFIGESKVEVVKQLIHRTNPSITVNAYNVDVFYDNGLLEHSLQNSDLCVVLTAEDSVDYFINDKFVNKYTIPFLFARASAGGLSGALQVVEAHKTACLRCLSRQGSDKLPSPKSGITLTELPPEYGSCSSPALPGSEVDTKEVAIQVTRVALQRLLKDTTTMYPKATGDQYFWHGPAGSKGKAPFTWEVKRIKPLSDCNICHG